MNEKLEEALPLVESESECKNLKFRNSKKCKTTHRVLRALVWAFASSIVLFVIGKSMIMIILSDLGNFFFLYLD